MPRLVKSVLGTKLHFMGEGMDKTRCGLWPKEKAPLVVNREDFCKHCFGPDHGKGMYSAAVLGIERIKE